MAFKVLSATMHFRSLLTVLSVILSLDLLAGSGVDPNVEVPIKLSGDWAATQDKTTHDISRETLASIDGYTTVTAELVPGTKPAELGVLPLSSLLKAFPLAGSADGLLLETQNEWESYLPLEYIVKENSMLLLYYNGVPPSAGSWPYFGGDIEPLAPYYVFDPTTPVPTFPTSPKYGMIGATQIIGIRAMNTQKRYAPFFDPPMDQLSESASVGRDIFLQRCNSCHKGPGNVGGDVSQRPFIILQTHAKYNAAYFTKVVTNPKQFYPDTSMPNHEDFRGEDFDALIAFLKESAELTHP
ncbi:MAG: c-type cytochrome [Verrucomicrobiota bacterium]